MRPDFLEPRGELNADTVFDAMNLVCQDPPPLEVVQRWTKMELLLAYDWAMRDHLKASDNVIKRRDRPWFTTISVFACLSLKDYEPRWRGHDFRNDLNDEDYCRVYVSGETSALYDPDCCGKPRRAHAPKPPEEDGKEAG